MQIIFKIKFNKYYIIIENQETVNVNEIIYFDSRYCLPFVKIYTLMIFYTNIIMISEFEGYLIIDYGMFQSYFRKDYLMKHKNICIIIKIYSKTCLYIFLKMELIYNGILFKYY
jgi:hypothetical protein